MNAAHHHIIMVFPSSPCIASKAVYQRVAYFSGRADVSLITGEEICAEHATRGVKAIPFVLPSMSLRRILFPLFALHHLVRLVRARPDSVIFAAYPNWCIVPALIAKRWFGTWLVLDLMDDPALAVKVAAKKGGITGVVNRVFQKWLFNYLVRHITEADRVVVVGDVKATRVAYGLENNALLEVTNGVEAALVRAHSAVEPDSERKLVYVGHVKEDRGSRVMLAMLRYLVKEDGMSAMLHLVGPVEEDERRHIEAFLNEEGLTGHCVVHGKQPHARVVELIDGSIAGLYPFPDRPELRDVSPIKLFEYIARGVPVVASDLPGVRRIVENRVSGMLVRPDDAGAWRDAVLALDREPGLRVTVADKATQVIKSFEWNTINAKVFDWSFPMFSSAPASNGSRDERGGQP